MKFKRNLIGMMVSTCFTAGVAPYAMAGFEVVSNSNTPYVYQLSGAQRKVIEVREQRVIGATANTLHQGQINMDLVMVPVAANKGVDMLTGLRGIVPQSQGWRVFAHKSVNTRAKVEWHQADNWLMALDGMLLKQKLIAEINWDRREITLVALSNKSYAAQLRQQDKERNVLRQTVVRQQYETPEPLIALRLQPAHASITEATSVAVASVEVPVRALAEVAEHAELNPIAVARPDEAQLERMVQQRVEQATRERLLQLQALEAQYREKLEQLNQRAQQVIAPETQSNSIQPESDLNAAAKKTRHTLNPMAMPGLMKTSYIQAQSDEPARMIMNASLLSEQVSSEDKLANTPVMQVAEPIQLTQHTDAAKQVQPAQAISFPVQTGIEVEQAAKTKWEISVHDKTLRNALTRMASKNGYSLSYQTKDQDIKSTGSYYGTFDEALRELEIASGKRIRTVESKLLGRLIIVTD